MPRAAVFGARNIGVDANTNTNTNAAAPPAPKPVPAVAAAPRATLAQAQPAAPSLTETALAISASIRCDAKFGLAALYVYNAILVALMFFIAIVVPSVPAYEAPCAQFARTLTSPLAGLQEASDFDACRDARITTVVMIPIAMVILATGVHFFYVWPMLRVASVIDALVDRVEALSCCARVLSRRPRKTVLHPPG